MDQTSILSDQSKIGDIIEVGTFLTIVKKVNGFGQTINVIKNSESGKPPGAFGNFFICLLIAFCVSSVCVLCCGITCLQEECGFDDNYEGGED